MPQYTITAEPNPSDQTITLLLNGKFGEEALPELDGVLADARRLQPHIRLDLSEVTLVDRKAAQYLAQHMDNVQLVNCPVYLRKWIFDGK